MKICRHSFCALSLMNLKSLFYKISLVLMIDVGVTILGQNTNANKIEEVLDQRAVPVMQGVFDRYLESYRSINLDLEGFIHMAPEGWHSLTIGTILFSDRHQLMI